MNSNNFKVLKEIIKLKSNYEIYETSNSILFSYLFSAGYLTKTENDNKFKLPNNEIKIEMQKKIIIFYCEQYKIGDEYFKDVTDKIQKIIDSKNDIEIKESIQEFKNSFIKLLLKFPKFAIINDENINDEIKDNIIHANKDLIYCIMFYVCFQIKNQLKFGSEVYLGKGIADIMFIDDLNKKSIIIELKFNIGSKIAIQQIKDKKYSQIISKKYETILIGLNVSKDKRVDISYKIIRIQLNN
jgi:hypothetical protein